MSCVWQLLNKRIYDDDDYDNDDDGDLSLWVCRVAQSPAGLAAANLQQQHVAARMGQTDGRTDGHPTDA